MERRAGASPRRARRRWALIRPDHTHQTSRSISVGRRGVFQGNVGLLRRIAVPGFGLSRPTRATSRLPSPLACRVVVAAHSNLERPVSANAVHRGSVLPVSQSEADSHVLGRNRRWRGYLSSFSAGRHVRIKGSSMGLTVTGNPVQWRQRDPSRHVPCNCWPWSSGSIHRRYTRQVQVGSLLFPFPD